MIKYLIPIILIVALGGCQYYAEPPFRIDNTCVDKEQLPKTKISIEKVLDMDKNDINCLPAECVVDLIYDLCQEVRRLRNE